MALEDQIKGLIERMSDEDLQGMIVELFQKSSENRQIMRAAPARSAAKPTSRKHNVFGRCQLCHQDYDVERNEFSYCVSYHPGKLVPRRAAFAYASQLTLQQVSRRSTMSRALGWITMIDVMDTRRAVA